MSIVRFLLVGAVVSTVAAGSVTLDEANFDAQV